MSTFTKTVWLCITVFIILLYAVINLYISYRNQAIWFDEAYSLAMFKRSWPEIISFTSKDFHPPLYYFIVKAPLSIFGYSTLLARVLSIIPSLLTMYFGAKFLRENFGNYTSFVFLALFYCSIGLMAYSQEIRMYSLAMFFVSLNFLSAFSLVQKPTLKNQISYTFFLVCTFYTHYYAAVIVGIGFLFLLYSSLICKTVKLKHILHIFLISTLLYLPWIYMVVFEQFKDASSDFWISSFQWNDLVIYVGSIFKTGSVISSVLLATAYMCILFLSLKLPHKSIKEKFLLAGFLSVAGMVIFGIALSLTVRPLFISRYITPGLGIFWIFFAANSSLLFKTRTWKYISLLFLFITAIFTQIQTSKLSNLGSGFNEFNAFMHQNLQQEDGIILFPPQEQGQLVGVIAYMFPNHDMYITNFDGGRKENKTLNYDVSPFHFQMFEYAKYKKSERNWLILPMNSDGLNRFSNLAEIKDYGNFSWQSFRTGYQFRLFLITQNSE